MTTTNLYDRFFKIVDHAKQLDQEIENIKADLTVVFEKNAELEIENKLLRERLAEFEKHETQADQQNAGLSRSRQNLENLYEEGFHVCPLFYGAKRQDDEPCAFCSEIIYS